METAGAHSSFILPTSVGTLTHHGCSWHKVFSASNPYKTGDWVAGDEEDIAAMKKCHEDVAREAGEDL